MLWQTLQSLGGCPPFQGGAVCWCYVSICCRHSSFLMSLLWIGQRAKHDKAQLLERRSFRRASSFLFLKMVFAQNRLSIFCLPCLWLYIQVVICFFSCVQMYVYFLNVMMYIDSHRLFCRVGLFFPPKLCVCVVHFWLRRQLLLAHYAHCTLLAFSQSLL